MPAPPVPPKAPAAAWSSLRELDVVLPAEDAGGGRLRGLEAVRVLYLPLGLARPTAADVAAHGEVVLERQRPALPAPGAVLNLRLQGLTRPSGWIVVVAVRAGRVLSPPSEVLPWLNPAL